MNQTKKGKISIKRQIRKNQILNFFRQNESLSPAEIAKLSELTLPMVSDLSKELYADGYLLIDETSKTKVGRPANYYTLNPDGGYVIGVHISVKKINIILLNLCEDIVLIKRHTLVDLQDEMEAIRHIEGKVYEVIEEAEIDYDKLLGIGIAITGLVDRENGRTITYLGSGEPLKKTMEERFKRPVFIENDVNAMALGEIYFGSGKNISHMACINLDWEIGMGLVFNKELYVGNKGLAGELGHFKAVDNGEICSCGKLGCLETVASGRALVSKAKMAMAEGTSSKVIHIVKGEIDDINLDVLITAAKQGDNYALKLFEEAGHYIGKTLGSMLNLLNLERILLEGRISELGNTILYPIYSSIIQNSLVEINEGINVECSTIHDKAASLGATTLISNHLFETPLVDANQFV